MILPLNSPQAKLDNAGGKGANLSKLLSAGFSVPEGFILTTEGYKEYIEANELGERILEQVNQIQSQDSPIFEQVSKEIRSWFSKSIIPPQITIQLQDAYEELGAGAVAVRSSATAEDLPELSFAGQQDTFLNILGIESLLQAVVDCWSSLWTARAISYRSKNDISHADVSLAVIVQAMVPSESSGIMFTANPLTGSRSETVIEAAFGLGEALVAGKVEPDHYVVDQERRIIISKSLGSKKISIQSQTAGGVLIKESDASEEQAISDEIILALAELGEQVNELYQFPQDIEWGFAGGKLSILQSRPITSLFPLPDGMSPSPLQVFFSFASVQGIMEPFTPLGQDAIRLIFAGGASLFGYDLTHETQPVIMIAGGRLWGDMTAVIHHPIGSRAAIRFLSAIEPIVHTNLSVLSRDPDLAFGKGKLRIATFKRLVRFAYPFLKHVFRYIRSPQGAADRIQQASRAEITRIKDKRVTTTDSIPPLKKSLDLFREIYNAFPYAIPEIASGAAAGLIPFFLLNKISTQLTGSGDLGLKITRGLPNNVTTEMDLALWETAKAIRSDQAAYQHLISTKPRILAGEYLEYKLPESAQSQVTNFLTHYGMRGLGEIDIGRIRWREDPTYIFEVLLGYLQIEDEPLAPDFVFRKGEQAAQQAIRDLQEIARGTFAGQVKAAMIGKLAFRVRELAGLRESPKFHIIQMFGIIRQALLASGEGLVAEEIIESPDDVFYLYLTELENLAAGNPRDWRGLIAERRAAYNRELSRNQIPRLLLSDGRAFYEGIESDDLDEDKLIGSPVSPGIVQGRVRVVLDPLSADLSPGEIMVCPGTDPAWTPLFLTAAGLIMEVGGMMTHGAIVAREYGIPAVVGVHQATTRLQTGQEIRLNGSTGEVYLTHE